MNGPDMTTAQGRRGLTLRLRRLEEEAAGVRFPGAALCQPTKGHPMEIEFTVTLNYDTDPDEGTPTPDPELIRKGILGACSSAGVARPDSIDVDRP
jgi:hypothetical protein